MQKTNIQQIHSLSAIAILFGILFATFIIKSEKLMPNIFAKSVEKDDILFYPFILCIIKICYKIKYTMYNVTK